MSRGRSRLLDGLLRWLLIAFAVLVLDQATKQVALLAFKTGERMPVIPGFFDLTLLFNRGAAFSFLADASGWQRWFFYRYRSSGCRRHHLAVVASRQPAAVRLGALADSGRCSWQRA